MGELATMAERHYRQFLPTQYAQIKDKPTFFQNLEDEAQEEIETRAEALAGPDPEGEPFATRTRRYQQAEFNAREAVIRELVLPDPRRNEDPPPELPGDFATAMTDFAEALDQLHQLNEEHPPRSDQQPTG